MQDHLSMIHYLYQHFYRKLYGNQKYKFDPSPAMEKQMIDFINLLDKKYKIQRIGIHFLINYFIYFFDFWTKAKRVELKHYSNRIQLNFIIGKKAFNERWLTRDQRFDYKILTSDFVKKYKIEINEITMFWKEGNSDPLNKSEELKKKRFYNTFIGFVYCIEATTLYNHKSSLCLTCKFKDDCIKILEKKFNKLYIERGYGRKAKKTSIN